MSRFLSLGLFALGGGLCAVIGLEAVSGPTVNLTPQTVAAARVLSSTDPKESRIASIPQRAWLNDILARPLFSPNRRPVETGVRGLPRLTGIVVAGSERLAIFSPTQGDHPIIAHAGTRVGPYEIREVADTGVMVAGPDGMAMIRPVFDANRPTSPGAVRPGLSRGTTK